MTGEYVIEATGLRKRYGAVAVLDGIDLRVSRSTVFSLLGPNGAGKTTTVRILSTLLRADAGSARVAGFDVAAEQHQVRRRISLSGQYAAVDKLQTGTENLRMIGQLAGLSRSAARERAAGLLETFDLVEAGRRRVGTYSGGMRRRLDLAATLVGNPAVIFLDEPTTGLDPRSRQQMWRVIERLVASGVTIFLTTQYLEEADQLADQVAVIDGGRIVASGTPDELKRRVGGTRLDLTLSDRLAYDEVSRQLGDRALWRDVDALAIGVPTEGSAPDVRALLDELDPMRVRISRFDLRQATLDDVFLSLTGHTTAQPEEVLLHV